MSCVYRKQYTKPIPQGAVLVTLKGGRGKEPRKVAQWRDRWGKKRTAPLSDDGDRILLRSRIYTAKFRNGAGQVERRSTGCRDKVAAESALAEWERRAERVRGKMLTLAEASALDHQETPLAEHTMRYLEHLRTKTVRGRRVSEKHVINVEHNLGRIISDCGFTCLRDITHEAVEKWLRER